MAFFACGHLPKVIWLNLSKKNEKSFSNFYLNGRKNWVLSIFGCIENVGDRLQAKTFVVKKTRILKSFLFCLFRGDTFCIFKKRSFDHTASTFWCIQFFFCSNLNFFFLFAHLKSNFTTHTGKGFFLQIWHFFTQKKEFLLFSLTRGLLKF